jgi:uncharacterized protein YjbJ (UPF0337 family)
MSATDKMKNAVEDVEGKAKEALGKATGDKSTENEGRGDQAKSDLKNAGENVKDAFKHGASLVARTAPGAGPGPSPSLEVAADRLRESLIG